MEDTNEATTKLNSSSRQMRNMAEKMRRDKLNAFISELATIIPLTSSNNKRIDKISILRLAANYIRMDNIMKGEKESMSPSKPISPILSDPTTTHALLDSLGGFVMLVTSGGKILFVSEGIEHIFGHSQIDVMGNSIFSILHPDDEDMVKQYLSTKESSRVSFFCRLMEKALVRNDAAKYEIVRIVGTIRPIPECARVSENCPVPAIRTRRTNKDAGYSKSKTRSSGSGGDSDSDNQQSDSQDHNAYLLESGNIGTHMLVAYVKVVNDKPITEISRVESVRDEYITRHYLDGRIIYSDHRISFVTGMMPEEVMKKSAFVYMHPEDMIWSIVAHKQMFASNQGRGVITYRLQCLDKSLVTLRSQGFLEFNKQTGEVDSFVCINTVLTDKAAKDEIINQRKRLLPLVSRINLDEFVESISAHFPSELIQQLKDSMNNDTVRKILKDVDGHIKTNKSATSSQDIRHPHKYQKSQRGRKPKYKLGIGVMPKEEPDDSNFDTTKHYKEKHRHKKRHYKRNNEELKEEIILPKESGDSVSHPSKSQDDFVNKKFKTEAYSPSSSQCARLSPDRIERDFKSYTTTQVDTLKTVNIKNHTLLHTEIKSPKIEQNPTSPWTNIDVSSPPYDPTHLPQIPCSPCIGDFTLSEPYDTANFNPKEIATSAIYTSTTIPPASLASYSDMETCYTLSDNENFKYN